MKNKKIISYILALTFVLLYCSSCEKKEDNPDYVGTWIQTETDNGVSYRDKLVINSNSFEQLYSMKIGNFTNWMDLYGIKGSLSVVDSLMTVEVNSIGEAEFNEQTLQISDMVWYDKGSVEFNDYLESQGMGTTMLAKFSVEGNTLTVTIDTVGNGTYDESNKLIFTRQ